MFVQIISIYKSRFLLPYCIGGQYSFFIYIKAITQL